MQKCLSLFFMLSIIIRLGFSPFPCPVCCVCLVLNHRLIFLITEHVMIMKVNQETFDNWVGNSAEIQKGSFLGLKQFNSNTWVLLWIVSCSGDLMWSMFVQRSVSRPKYKDQHERLRWSWVCRPPVVIWGLGRAKDADNLVQVPRFLTWACSLLTLLYFLLKAYCSVWYRACCLKWNKV